MNNTDWERISIETITQLENMTCNQNDIDSNYVNFCYALFAEADKYLDYVSSSHKTRKMFKNHKPFWTSELTNLWKEMKESEKLFVKCGTSHSRRNKYYQSFKSLLTVIKGLIARKAPGPDGIQNELL